MHSSLGELKVDLTEMKYTGKSGGAKFVAKLESEKLDKDNTLGL